ncbi:site-specific integrase [Rhodococcus spongiicola]|uniref:hypothetical protein n=1 Tax=Rhodococcus spongiicola TaxID=2487352 RepID=UPI0019D44756|nr:hypothetical protein [Rhodococcus spongiicola]
MARRQLPRQIKKIELTTRERGRPVVRYQLTVDTDASQFALSGLRRGEVCGLLSGDVDLEAGMLTIANNRVSVNGSVVEGEPKADRSARTLPSRRRCIFTASRPRSFQRGSGTLTGPSPRAPTCTRRTTR